MSAHPFLTNVTSHTYIITIVRIFLFFLLKIDFLLLFITDQVLMMSKE